MHGSYRSPTIHDVARLAGVSIATVSRVLNESALVTPQTAQAVHNAIAELNYIPHQAARALAGQRTQTIGLILPEISGAFFQPLLRGVEAEAQEVNYNLLIQTTAARQQTRGARLVGEHNTDGLIVFTDSLDEEELKRLFRVDFPLILLHQSPPDGTTIPVISVENKSGAYKLIDHLIQAHGRRRIAYLRGPQTHEDSFWREQGYLEALYAHAISYDPDLVGFGNFDENQAYRTVRQWLSDGLEFDAIFTGDDDAATGVLDALQEAGRRIPQEVAVAGFDDVPIARYLTPPLTTVRAPIEELGRRAVQQLICQMRDECVDPLILLPTELVIRQSCGCGVETTIVD